MKLFEMKHIKKNFDGLEVLKDISLDVEEGEVLSIIGPSGSGKSTILRCATGLETPDSGEIIKNGDVGLVFQQFNLFPHFSVLKNIVDAPLKVQKRKKDEVYAQARSLLKKMGLADKEKAYPFHRGLACARIAGDQVQTLLAQLFQIDLGVSGIRAECGQCKFQRSHLSSSQMLAISLSANACCSSLNY